MTTTETLLVLAPYGEANAAEKVEALESIGFAAEVFKYGESWTARVTDLRGTDIRDAVFELGWHDEYAIVEGDLECVVQGG